MSGTLDRIVKLQAELNQLLDDEAAAAAQPGVPLPVVRQLITQGNGCLCAVGLRLLAAQAAQNEVNRDD